MRLLRAIGNLPQEGHLWDTLGYAHFHLGHYTRAADCYQRAVQIMDDHDYRHTMAVTLISAGQAYQAADDAQAAGDAWRQALAILEETRHPGAAVLANLRDLMGAADVSCQPEMAQR